MKKLVLLFLILPACMEVEDTLVQDRPNKGGAFTSPIAHPVDAWKIEEDISSDTQEDASVNDLEEVRKSSVIDVFDSDGDIILEEVIIDVPTSPVPTPPYSFELFGVIPDMAFYDPWEEEWTRIYEFFKHPKHKALLLVSSAGWCDPCQKEAAELVDLYDDFHEDGLEIMYTLLQSFEPLDYIFVNPDQEEEDLWFMEQWKTVPLYRGKSKSIQYPLYADPLQEFNKYLDGYGIPYTVLITTKDMGIRFLGPGYAPSYLENKIMMVLYNDVPTIPFD